MTLAETSNARAAQYDRDFSAITATGANTIVGWDEREFDDLLLTKAADYHLGVILPFELPVDFAYEDASATQALLEKIRRRVESYESSPALRMWGLGNESEHDIVRARGSLARQAAFGTFLVQAADLVHRMDPHHPVVYRDAEDAYLYPVAAALAADGQSRPWFVYGMNFFTNRMDAALALGPTSRFPHALLISEFAPIGTFVPARPDGYRQLWGIIQGHGDKVLGGAAYVWSTAGPEPLDRNFGLTDVSGRPVDGSLAAITALFKRGEWP